MRHLLSHRLWYDFFIRHEEQIREGGSEERTIDICIASNYIALHWNRVRKWMVMRRGRNAMKR